MKLHLVQLDLLGLAVQYHLSGLVLQQHLYHLWDLADQLVPGCLECLVFLVFLANLPDLVDQPFLLVLQDQVNLGDLAHQVRRLLQGFQKLFLQARL